MANRAFHRLLISIGLILGVVTITFFLINLAPGDPARLWVGPNAGEVELNAARRALGLDRPLIVQYTTWLGNFVSGDWGTSLIQHRPVVQIITDALPITLALTVTSLALTYLIGVLIGAFQGARHNSRSDRAITVGALVLHGVPSYWLAMMLVLIFAYAAARFGWPDWLQLPALGIQSLDADFLSVPQRILDRVRHLVLPVATLTAVGAAGLTRFVRGAVLDVRRAPHVYAARARGLPSSRVETRYILRNALIPLVTLLGLTLPVLFSGTVFVEVIFAIPGMGREIVGAVANRDYPVVMASTTIFAALVVLGNLLADLLYGVVDPRMRVER